MRRVDTGASACAAFAWPMMKMRRWPTTPPAMHAMMIGFRPIRSDSRGHTRFESACCATHASAAGCARAACGAALGADAHLAEYVRKGEHVIRDAVRKAGPRECARLRVRRAPRVVHRGAAHHARVTPVGRDERRPFLRKVGAPRESHASLALPSQWRAPGFPSCTG